MALDIQEFKRAVRRWMKQHPAATEEKLLQYCEELLPAHLYPSHSWVVEQTLMWWNYTQKLRQAPLPPPWYAEKREEQ